MNYDVKEDNIVGLSALIMVDKHDPNFRNKAGVFVNNGWMVVSGNLDCCG